MNFFKALFKIIFFPIKLIFKLVWKVIKWIIMAPIRWIFGLIFTIGLAYVLIRFVIL